MADAFLNCFALAGLCIEKSLETESRESKEFRKT